MQIVDTRPPQAKQENRIFRAIGCTAVYLTSAGALCSIKVSSGFLSFCCLALRCGFCGSPRATAFVFS